MNIFNNPIYAYLPLNNLTNIFNNKIILTESEYNNLIVYQKYVEEENIKKTELNKLYKKYLYIQNDYEYVDILKNYQIILKLITEDYALISFHDETNIYKLILNKSYQHLYKSKNFFHEGFEIYIPTKNEIFFVYKRNPFTKNELKKIMEHHYLLNDFQTNHIKDINILLQLYIPQLPKIIRYNKYNIDDYINNIYKKIYNEKQKKELTSISLINFFKSIEKISKFTVFGGISLKYFYKKYVNNISDNDNFLKETSYLDTFSKDNTYILESNDYDLNITYLKDDLKDGNYDNLTYYNYIIYMIYNINLLYNKKIIDTNISLNVNNENSPYINMYMTFSNKDDMNIYIWLLSHHTCFKLKMYYSNILYIKEDEIPHIYKAQFINEELNSILTLKYIENSIVDVKAIIKLEVHNNQNEPLEVRVNKKYTCIDFIFREDVNTKYSVYDNIDKLYYNNPIFLLLVYIDLVQKYDKKCISVKYREEIGKKEKDKMRYVCIVKNILIPFMLDQKDYLLYKLFSLINDEVYKNILMEELLKFNCKANIYIQMDEFYNFLIEKVEEIIYKYFNNETYRYIKINDYYICGIQYEKYKSTLIEKKEEKKEEYNENISIEMVYKMNDFLRILYDEKNIEYNIINLYNGRLEKKVISLENIDFKKCDLNECINKLSKLLHFFENIKKEYKSIYDKLKDIKYKNDIAYEHFYMCNQKIDFINEKIKIIEKDIDINNKRLYFENKIEKIIKEKYKKYKEEEKKLKIMKKAELRKMEKEKEEECMRLKKEQKNREKELLELLQLEEKSKQIKEEEIKRKNAIIQKYKEDCINVFLYIPRKTIIVGIYIKKKVYIYGYNIYYILNWIYKNVSFFTLLKICSLLLLVGLLCYGKYVHDIDEQKRLEVIRIHEAKIRYNQRYNYKRYN